MPHSKSCVRLLSWVMPTGVISASLLVSCGQKNMQESPTPVVIAHRGASGYVPEHTLAAYAIAILHGADYVEPDLVMTKDGHLIARHDNVLNLTTDVARRSEFANRKTTKVVDGAKLEDSWFSEDFTLKEIKQLRAIERIPQVRPASAHFDGQFGVPTLQEIIDLVKGLEKVAGRQIGLCPETKHPTYFAKLGLAMEEPLVDILHRNGYSSRHSKVFIQSFEVGNLKKLRGMTRLPLLQLLSEGTEQPYDIKESGGSLTYGEMATPQGLAEIARYADSVGPEKYHFIIPKDATGKLDVGNARSLVRDAHAAGLKVYPYTFRAENFFLPADLTSSGNPAELGNCDSEVRAFLETGIDGFFIDQPNIGVRARDAFAAGRK